MLMVYVKLNQEFSFLCLLMPYSTKQNKTGLMFFQTVYSTMPGEGGIMPQQEYDRKHSPHLVSGAFP